MAGESPFFDAIMGETGVKVGKARPEGERAAQNPKNRVRTPEKV